MKKTILIFAALLAGFSARGELKVKQPCSDGMVLQQNSLATVWGHASPEATINIVTSWDNASYRVTTDSKGVWKTSVSTPAASYTPYSIEITGDGDEMTISDVLIGEVWLASGQSNMEMPMLGYFNCPVEGAQQYISAAPSTDRVRMFKVPRAQSYEPLEDIDGFWAGAGPSTIPDMSATGYFFARELNEVLDVPVGILFSAYGGARIESWTPRDIVETYGENLSPEAVEAVNEYHRPFKMYNAMLNPIKGYTIKGFIWYQGCSNVGKHEEFITRQGNLVRRWRSDFGDTSDSLPFYMVELAPYQYGNPGTESYVSLFRAEQHRICEVVPNMGVAVTNDLVYEYEKDNIHPCRKREVGERLAYLALNRDYGFTRIAADSPRAYEVFRIDGFGSEMGVRLTNCRNGLNRSHGIEGLEVCGPDMVWYPVSDAVFEWDGYLRIRCSKVADPRQVRYGWGDYNPGNLTNSEGLPVAPFLLKL